MISVVLVIILGNTIYIWEYQEIVVVAVVVASHCFSVCWLMRMLMRQ